MSLGAPRKTIVVNHPDGNGRGWRIALTDYDPARHALWAPPDSAPEPEPTPTPAPTPEVKPTARRGRPAGSGRRS